MATRGGGVARRWRREAVATRGGSNARRLRRAAMELEEMNSGTSTPGLHRRFGTCSCAGAPAGWSSRPIASVSLCRAESASSIRFTVTDLHTVYRTIKGEHARAGAAADHRPDDLARRSRRASAARQRMRVRVVCPPARSVSSTRPRTGRPRRPGLPRLLERPTGRDKFGQTCSYR